MSKVKSTLPPAAPASLTSSSHTRAQRFSALLLSRLSVTPPWNSALSWPKTTQSPATLRKASALSMVRLLEEPLVDPPLTIAALSVAHA